MLEDLSWLQPFSGINREPPSRGTNEVEISLLEPISIGLEPALDTVQVKEWD